MMLKLFGGTLVVLACFFGTLWMLDRSAQNAGRPQHDPNEWQEELYVAVNQDVAAAVKRRDFRSGLEHYQMAGKNEKRRGGYIPANWDEAGYLKANPDVENAVKTGMFVSGYHHYLAAGQREGRKGGMLLERR
jgi:hypothetical protein